MPTYDPATGTPVTVANANSNGQNTMNNSAPVVIASDQVPVSVKGSTVNSAAPGQAFWIGITDFSGFLQGLKSIGALAPDSVDPQSVPPSGVYGFVGSNLMNLLR